MNHKKIGVQNFRVFKDYTEFELRPITLLTGPNNSGKSSFTKLLLLLNEGLNPLNFTKGNHNLEEFSKILNWNTDDPSLTIALPVNNFFGPGVLMHLEYKEGKINSFQMKDGNRVILSLDYQEEVKEETNSFFKIIEDSQKLYFDINYVIGLILNKKFYVAQNRTYKVEDKQQKSSLQFANKITPEFVMLNNIDNKRNVSRTLNLSNLKEKYEEIVLAHNEVLESQNLSNFALFNEIDNLDENELLFTLRAGGQNITDSYREELLKAQGDSFANLIFNFSSGPDLDIYDLPALFDKIFESILSKIRNSIISHFRKLLETEDITLELNSLGNLLFEAKVFNDEPENQRFYQKTIFDSLSSIDFSFNEKLEYVSANRGNQKRVLHNSSDSDIDQIVLEFSQLKDQNLPFLKKALEILEIEGELEVNRYQNYISVVSIQNKGRNIPLADIGFGYSQIIPVVLKIIVMMESSSILIRDTRGLLILEEPEANLHPNLQSKFADLLKIAQEFYPNLNFIIETHSEYLIRKLQFLTAKKELSPEQSVIYYFNADKYVSREEPKVKKIEITPTGNLTDTFGPGFYDEATRLQFDLMKINREQNN
ncbi:DUF3696 domain-containing protein [Salegentibacter mishustinae]|uniref:DUF3696 domain-containing protein n=1 Tax=Salegentibacter mishustinae TaxID=270918 RepID=UPI0024918E86|nr:DUF3696 domain-containing protein [Salegentibacter mishustinae]